MKKNAKGDGNEACAFCNNQFTFSFFNFSYKICNDCKKVRETRKINRFCYLQFVNLF